MQPIWMVVFLFVGLAFAQEDYEDYFNLFDEKAQVTSTTTTTQKSTTEKPTEKPTTTTEKLTTKTEKQSTTTAIPSTTTTMRITTTTRTTLTPATTTTPSAIDKMDATELFNARLESLFIKLLKSINFKMDQMPENFVKELSKISTTTTTTTTTRPTPPPTPHPLPPTPPPTPPKIERFLTDNVFEEDFFNDEKIEVSTEENTTYLWINKNLQVVIGVCVGWRHMHHSTNLHWHLLVLHKKQGEKER